MKPGKNRFGHTWLKRALSLLLAGLLLLPAAFAWAEEEESVERNRVLTALESARELAAGHQADLERFLALGEAERIQAQDRGKRLAALVNATQKTETFVLEGDTDLSAGDLPMNGSNSKIFTIDLNGHVLYAPLFTYGIFILKNGTAVDVSAENEDGILKITVEEDCCVLKDTGTAGLSLDVMSDLYITNCGLVNGIRRMIYQNAKGAKVSLVNEGTIWSETFGVSVRCFHQNIALSISNQGTVAGLIRGLDVHCAGGSLSVDGAGSWIGVAGPDLEIPKVSLGGRFITDDLNLDEASLATVMDKLDPYGDKGAVTGVTFDLQSGAVSYWRNWKITARLWASRGILRISLPQNEKIKGKFAPALEEDSPSRGIALTAELEGARTELTGAAVQAALKDKLGSFSLESFFAQGGEMDITAYCRAADENGKLRVRYSVCDTPWSRITGKRTGDGYVWNEAENGTIEPRAASNAWNAFYQLRSALALAGNGSVFLDEDAELPEGEGTIALAQNAEIISEGNRLSGDLSFSVDKNATLEYLDMNGVTLRVKGVYRFGDNLNLRNCLLGTLKADHLRVQMINSRADRVEITLTGGKEEAYTLDVKEELQIVATERLSGDFLFSGSLGERIQLKLQRNSLAKNFTFDGQTGAETIDVLIVSDRDPSVAWQPQESISMNFYASYLRMIHPENLTGPKGKRPTVTFRDEAGNKMITYALLADGTWSER